MGDSNSNIDIDIDNAVTLVDTSSFISGNYLFAVIRTNANENPTSNYKYECKWNDKNISEIDDSPYDKIINYCHFKLAYESCIYHNIVLEIENTNAKINLMENYYFEQLNKKIQNENNAENFQHNYYSITSKDTSIINKLLKPYIKNNTEYEKYIEFTTNFFRKIIFIFENKYLNVYNEILNNYNNNNNNKTYRKLVEYNIKSAGKEFANDLNIINIENILSIPKDAKQNMLVSYVCSYIKFIVEKYLNSEKEGNYLLQTGGSNVDDYNKNYLPKILVTINIEIENYETKNDTPNVDESIYKSLKYFQIIFNKIEMIVDFMNYVTNFKSFLKNRHISSINTICYFFKDKIDDLTKPFKFVDIQNDAETSSNEKKKNVTKNVFHYYSGNNIFTIPTNDNEEEYKSNEYIIDKINQKIEESTKDTDKYSLFESINETGNDILKFIKQIYGDNVIKGSQIKIYFENPKLDLLIDEKNLIKFLTVDDIKNAEAERTRKAEEEKEAKRLEEEKRKAETELTTMNSAVENALKNTIAQKQAIATVETTLKTAISQMEESLNNTMKDSSEDELEETENIAKNATKIALENAQTALENATNSQNELKDAQTALESSKIALESSQKTLEASQTALESSQKTLQDAQKTLEASKNTLEALQIAQTQFIEAETKRKAEEAKAEEAKRKAEEEAKRLAELPSIVGTMEVNKESDVTANSIMGTMEVNKESNVPVNSIVGTMEVNKESNVESNDVVNKIESISENINKDTSSSIETNKTPTPIISKEIKTTDIGGTEINIEHEIVKYQDKRV